MQFNWGGGDLRFQLEPTGAGTRLTRRGPQSACALGWQREGVPSQGWPCHLSAVIARPYIAMGAAGWHLCLDVLARHLSGAPLGRIAGPAALQNPAWQRLHVEYAKRFGLEIPAWAAKP